MKQVFESIASLKTKISNFIHYEVSNSHNKVEYHFHGPVNFMGKTLGESRLKTNSLPSESKKN